VLRSLEERERGDLILDAKRNELVAIRGAKLLRLESAQGTKRVDLSDCFTQFVEYENNIDEGDQRVAVVGILSAEGEMVVLNTLYFNHKNGDMRSVCFQARRRIAQLEP